MLVAVFLALQIGSRDTLCYQLNGLVFLLVYFVFRILTVPLVYLVYAYQHHEGSLWRAVTSMRLQCHVVVLLGFVFLFYWFLEALKKALQDARRVHKEIKN